MEIHFVGPRLHHLDQLRCEALAIPFFGDERPLQGLLGEIDWRMCGMLSRLIIRGRIAGGLLETTLVAARPRLALDKLLLFGAGLKPDFGSETLESVTRHMLRTLAAAQVRASALVLPGRVLSLVEPVHAIEVFLRLSAVHAEHDEIILVETPEAQKAMDPLVERERRRARARTEQSPDVEEDW